MARVTESARAELAEYLEGIHFPAIKQQLLEWAEENGAPEETLDLIRKLPNRQYVSMADVMAGCAEIE